jgi:hypothetical protein
VNGVSGLIPLECAQRAPPALGGELVAEEEEAAAEDGSGGGGGAAARRLSALRRTSMSMSSMKESARALREQIEKAVMVPATPSAPGDGQQGRSAQRAAAAEAWGAGQRGAGPSDDGGMEEVEMEEGSVGYQCAASICVRGLGDVVGRLVLGRSRMEFVPGAAPGEAPTVEVRLFEEACSLLRGALSPRSSRPPGAGGAARWGGGADMSMGLSWRPADLVYFGLEASSTSGSSRAGSPHRHATGATATPPLSLHSPPPSPSSSTAAGLEAGSGSGGERSLAGTSVGRLARRSHGSGLARTGSVIAMQSGVEGGAPAGVGAQWMAAPSAGGSRSSGGGGGSGGHTQMIVPMKAEPEPEPSQQMVVWWQDQAVDDAAVLAAGPGLDFTAHTGCSDVRTAKLLLHAAEQSDHQRQCESRAASWNSSHTGNGGCDDEVQPAVWPHDVAYVHQCSSGDSGGVGGGESVATDASGWFLLRRMELSEQAAREHYCRERGLSIGSSWAEVESHDALQLRSTLSGFATTTIVRSPRSPVLSHQHPFSRDDDGGGGGGGGLHDDTDGEPIADATVATPCPTVATPCVVHGTQTEQVSAKRATAASQRPRARQLFMLLRARTQSEAITDAAEQLASGCPSRDASAVGEVAIPPLTLNLQPQSSVFLSGVAENLAAAIAAVTTQHATSRFASERRQNRPDTVAPHEVWMKAVVGTARAWWRVLGEHHGLPAQLTATPRPTDNTSPRDRLHRASKARLAPTALRRLFFLLLRPLLGSLVQSEHATLRRISPARGIFSR